MELTSIHPVDQTLVEAYVAVLDGADPARLPLDPSVANAAFVAALRRAREGAQAGDEASANLLTHGFGQILASTQPSFFHQGLSLTAWEARIDRGVGMLMRPPARLFIEAGLDVAAARTMPTRLDLSRGMMGGAFIPSRLIPELELLLERRFERSVRRLIDAELDPVAVLGLMYEIVRYAKERGTGLFEAMDVVTPDHPAAMPSGATIVVADRKRIDPALRKRIEIAAKPVKKPGLLARMMGRGARTGNGLANYPDEGLQ